MNGSFSGLMGLLVLLVMLGMPGAACGDGFPDVGLFGTPAPVPNLTNVGVSTVSPDGNQLLFTRGSGIFEAEWSEADGQWNEIGPLPLGSGGWETHPSISPDGEWLFYVASTGNPFTSVIYRSTKQPNGDWGAGAPVLGDVQMLDAPAAPMFDRSNNLLYLREYESATRYDLYVSEYDPNSDNFSLAAPLTTINDGSENDGPYVSDDGKELMFHSTRDGTYDVWMSAWNETLGEWNTPFKPDWPINTDTTGEYFSRYSPARSTMYFIRDGVFYQSQVIPEPSSFVVWFLGVAVLAYCGWRRRGKAA